MHILLDTGPWVASLCKDVQHHEWAKQQFANYTGPFLTCEAVAAETCFLLARGGSNAGRALALIERGVVQSGMALSQEIAPVRELYQRYDNLPASLADACLVRMSELYEPCAVRRADAGKRLSCLSSAWTQGDTDDLSRSVNA